MKIGVIANDYPAKGLKYFYEAVEVLRDKGFNVEALVIGKGSKIGAKEDPWKYFAEKGGVDIFVIPSIKEGLPYVLLEAMNARLPIVATNAGGISEVIENEKNGLIVPIKSSLALVEAMERLINDPALKEKISNQAAIDIKKYTIEKMISQVDSLYRELI